jgi:peptide methionine sulfoxide reductase MsrB
MLKIYKGSYGLSCSKSEEQWKKKVRRKRYRILREKRNRTASTGAYNLHYTDKVRIIVCGPCAEPLFK